MGAEESQMKEADGSGDEVLKTKVYFRWYLPKTKADEEVRVIGDCPELGNWELNEGVPLESDTSCPGCWRSSGVLLPLKKRVEYQYVVIDKSTGSKSLRSLDAVNGKKRQVVPTGMCHILEDDGGKFREFDMQGDTKMDERKLSVDGSQSSPKPQNMSRHLSHGSQSRFTMEKMEELKETEKELQLSNKDTVIAVFRMLPFRVERDEGGGWRVVEEKKQKKSPVSPVSLLGQTQAEGQQPYNIKFVGQPGVFVEDPNERKEIQKLLAPHNCIPVFVNESAAQKHIQTCHQYLWPVFHNMKVFLGPTNNSEIEKDGWKTFKDVNKAYADAIAANMDPQTLVWIHDYHLIMVARFLFLNRDMQCAGLGFFLHSAFPSSEVLRCIPMRIELLQSLLSCHCVTFQIFEYARHFLTCCKVLLNCNYSFQEGGVLQVEHESRSIVVRTDHVVLPYNKLLQRIDDSPKIIDRAKSIRDQYPDRTIFGAIDGDEPFAGLTLKMRAFHSFVSDCPDHRSKVAFVQHIVVTKHNDQGSADLIRIVRQMADEINAKYCRAGDPPLVTIKTEDSDTDERLAILLATDVLLDTSINDGLNLYPFMFYCAHAKSQKGVVIVSEFTGCSNVLTGAMKINPWNTKAVVDAMNEAIMVIAPESNALYESEAETNKRKRESSVRFIQDHSYVSTQTFDKWVHQNMVDLKACRHSKSNTINMDLGFEKRFLNSGARALSMDNVVRDYRQCKGTRLIFVDNEGTISPDRRHVLRYGVNAGLNSAPMTCDPDTIEALRMLASDQRNIVVVISGREREVLDECFGDIASLGLCAEHGFYWTMPGRLQPCKVLDSAIGRDGREPSPESKQHERWRSKNSLSEQDNDWKTVCVELFKMYTKRVQGSIIEQKGSAVSWIYHQVGAQDLAQPVALELARLVDPSEPQGLMEGYPVEVVAGTGYVEVKRAETNKGDAVLRTFKTVEETLKTRIDFVLCIGDDRSDEDMFQAVHDLEESAKDKPSRASSGLPRGYGSEGNLCGKEGSGRGSETSLNRMGDKEGSCGNLSDIMSPGLGGGGFVRQTSADAHLRGSGLSRVLSRTSDEDGSIGEEPKFFYTATVGRKPSRATYFAKDIEFVSTLLQKLAKEGIRTKFSKFSSVPDLAAMGSMMGEGAGSFAELDTVLESD